MTARIPQVVTNPMPQPYAGRFDRLHAVPTSNTLVELQADERTLIATTTRLTACAAEGSHTNLKGYSSMAIPEHAHKDTARFFLETLADKLSAKLPPPTEMDQQIRAITTASKTDPTKRHMRLPEQAFINTFVIPTISETMKAHGGINDVQARQSLLVEGYANIPRLSSGTPARTERHPFSKLIEVSETEMIRKWKGENGQPFVQSCPDFATRNPFPHKIVFEAKYFSQGSLEKAERDLVSGIYQAFFYRALPYVPPKKTGAAWDYDFACLLAVDASRDGTLHAAWANLTSTVRSGFWNGANVYVMVLRP